MNLICDRFGISLLIRGGCLVLTDACLTGKVMGKMPGVRNQHSRSPGR
ncbi:MAG: hypothetical protein R2941_03985 [Desulfobacterales bacterium]